MSDELTGADFDTILRQTQVRIRAYIAGMGIAPHEVDDVAQTVYVELFKNFEKIPTDVPVLSITTHGAAVQLAEMAGDLGADAILLVSIRNPFIDSALIDRLVTAAENSTGCDYTSYCQRDGTPAVLSPLGVHAQWLSVTALRRAAAEVQQGDIASVTQFILAHPQRYTIQQIQLPDELDQADFRFTVDSEEDLERTQELYEALGPEQLDWQRLAEFLKQQPRLRQRMAALNRKAQEHELPTIDNQLLDAPS